MTTDPVRRRLRLRGIVQGVGFRPHVHRVAGAHAVTGFVLNDGQGVTLEVQGPRTEVDAFGRELLATLPPLARVDEQSAEDIAPIEAEDSFTIHASAAAPAAMALIPPDVAICADCRRELADPADRRYHYPFITCVNCGPRLTIIEDLPYDRPATTMSKFPMCDACRTEYTDPANRRHHAQPVSCPDCGPSLWLEAPGEPGTPTRDFAPVLDRAHALLNDGKILAVKGIGGFHLMCDAGNEAAVAELRRRKRRPHKPFAVMVADAGAARDVVTLNDAAEAELTSPAAPIVIAPMRPGAGLAPSIAPGLADVGVMVAYSPLHVLLVDRPMVATSGNPPGEPLCHDNADARRHLAHLADAFLLHDRRIHVPVEDSVYVGDRPIRRSRGHAPLPVRLPAGGTCALAVGGELKNTFAIVDGATAHISPHIGDMGSLAAQQRFTEMVDQMLRFRHLSPDLVVHDLHPGYATTRWALDYANAHDLPTLAVQHHHAHALSLLAEHGIADGPAVIATIDGTGYGTDGTIWGGEVLTLGANPLDFDRMWHVPRFALAGGDRAVRHPWRLAAGLAHSWDLPEVAGALAGAPELEAQVLAAQLDRGTGVVPTSSLGRLFDAASVLLRSHATRFDPVTHEGQAAMELEALAGKARGAGVVKRDLRELMRLLCDARIPAPERAFSFHASITAVLADALIATAQGARTDVVGVTGGCALNRLLERLLTERLADAGLQLLRHRVVPAGDGGLSLGQAFAAAQYGLRGADHE